MNNIPDTILLSQVPVADLVELVANSVCEKLSNLRPTGPQVPEKLVSEKELCEYLTISLPTVIRWRQKGVIPFLQIGSTIRYDLVKVLAAIENKNSVKC